MRMTLLCKVWPFQAILIQDRELILNSPEVYLLQKMVASQRHSHYSLFHEL
jgi:hypothetical protein